jgi:GNAT superfamily N-acetyltransferase
VTSQTKFNPVLRQAVSSDAETIAALHTESWRNSYRGILLDDYLDGAILEERRSYWRESLNAPNAERRFILLAECDRKAVAFVSAYLDVEPEFGVLLHNLHVLPQLKGQGLGRLIVGEAAQWTLLQNVKQIHLWVFEVNHDARKFYEKLGGKAVEEKRESVAGSVERKLLRYLWTDLNFLANLKEKL